MTIQYEPIETHLTHSRRLIRQAEAELEKGDRLQASEKTWGAVAHYLKFIAERRGWRYRIHADAFTIVERLAAETTDAERMETLFRVANSMHQNFYTDLIPEEGIGKDIERVKELLMMFERMEG